MDIFKAIFYFVVHMYVIISIGYLIDLMDKRHERQTREQKSKRKQI